MGVGRKPLRSGREQSQHLVGPRRVIGAVVDEDARVADLVVVAEPENDVAIAAVPFDERQERALPGEPILACGVTYHPAVALARVIGEV